MGGPRPSPNRGRQSYTPRRSQQVPEPVARPTKLPPPVYGAAFIILEDAQKNTFEYVGGNWQPFGRSIADCRLDCQVTQLAQKVNNMTRYEVRAQV